LDSVALLYLSQICLFNCPDILLNIRLTVQNTLTEVDRNFTFTDVFWFRLFDFSFVFPLVARFVCLGNIIIFLLFLFLKPSVFLSQQPEEIIFFEFTELSRITAIIF